MNSDWMKDLSRTRLFIEKALLKYFPPPDKYTFRVRRAMQYSLMGGGKRIRPLLCLMACKAVGGRTIQAYPAACALEYIHTYSLIHDDLPALDNDDLRRGQPTCHKKYGEATAILAGDALLTEAFSLLSRSNVMRNTPAEIRISMIQEVAKASGIKGMVAGQEADLSAEKKKISLDALKYIHRNKTGALIRASRVCGGLVGGGKEKEIKALKTFGEKIGLAFQVKDDLLNVEGKSELMGKGTGTDEKKSKATYPLLIGMEQSRIIGKTLLKDACKALGIFGSRGEPLIQIGTYILSRDR